LKSDYITSAFGRDSLMLRLCVAGAAGKMGNAVIREAASKGHQVVGATEASGNVSIGKSLRELGIGNFDACILSSENLNEAVGNADVYVTFTTPAAEIQNIPVVASLGKRIVLGTTGLNNEQNQLIREAVQNRVPAVFSPNYSIGVNVLFKLAKVLEAFPKDYTFSISEIHHTAKKDAPSGTAVKLGEIIAGIRGYTTTVHGREGTSLRKSDELEIAALRAGGVPGIHDLLVAGPYEMLRIEHTAFSRSVFAQGAIHSAEWLSRQTEPRIFDMADVLGLS
jgi:4-hydroxy-tetrahydrodipicolinate reductase